ncbi:MAG TPA: hypothetical protein VL240_03420 [Candidatus Binatia bacterium]|nr:hypothetical protein [Candidatus Binatia bacterium]
MSGYLQRLARSVTQPAETVHPMLGSVYSPVEYGRGGETLEQNIAVTAREATGASPQEPEEYREPQPALTPLLPPGQPASAARPMSQEATGAQPVRSVPVEFQPLLSAAPNPDSASERQPRRATSSEANRRDEQAVGDYKPLLAEAPARTRPPQVASPKPKRTGAAEDRTSSRRTENEPDDIQIHIGRIEVTAVQQAPQRAPLKALHKGQSLDEYLKRRDRRA